MDRLGPIISFCTLIWLAGCTASNVKDVTVQTRYGEVVGRRQQENYDLGNEQVTNTVDVFLGIPYAAPPTGDFRFKPPRPPSRWQQPLMTLDPGPVCPQKPYYSQTKVEKQSEDCLNLNIYSPYQELNTTARYPVMVYIHGGSNEEGAGIRYSGLALAQYGVVVVTINYRLGLLGFFTNGKSMLPGNYGLLDQIEALRWISENIGNFRGESCEVTVFGNSAGSADIGLLMLSPEARGLFNRAVMQSGSPFAFWAAYNSTVDHESFFHDVATFMGCTEEEDESRLDCLKKPHFNNFTESYDNFTRITPSTAVFKPRVDGYVIPDSPRAMFRAAQYKNISVMTGTVENEWNGNMGWFLEDLDGIDKDYSDGMDRESLEKSIYHVIVDRFWWPREVADAVIFEYTNWDTSPSPSDNVESYASFMSDLAMVAPSVELAEILAGHGTSVFQYRFNHSSVNTEKSWYKCYHALELDHVFGSPFIGYNIAEDGMRNHTETDRVVSRTMMTLWSNFAKHGKADSGDVIWPRLDTIQKQYLYIGSGDFEIRSQLRPKKVAFWNVLVPQLLATGSGRVDNSLASKSRPTDMKLTLMWFFGILSFLSFIVMLAVVVRNGNIKKKLTKALAMAAQE